MTPNPSEQSPHGHERSIASLISCCIIAKNEADMLPGCLASVAGFVDEVIVVDTGSDDGTPELAAKLGARVFHQPWQDNFSAPRNLAAEQASGRWILLLDADERLVASNVEALRVAIAVDDMDCGLLPLYDADSLDAASEDVVGGQATLSAPVLLPRLFRNRDELKWEGLIHERPTSWLARGPKRIRTLEQAAIAHYGCIPELRQEKGKSGRNRSLLEKQAALTPDDPRILDYLAYALKEAGEIDRATEKIGEAWGALQRTIAASPNGPKESVVTIATLHANYLRDEGQIEAAIKVLETALGWCKGSQEHEHPNLLFQLGVGLEVKALRSEEQEVRERCLAGARTAYETCLQKQGVMFQSEVNPPDCVGSLAWKRLGTVALMGGDSATARDAMEQVLATRHDDVEAHLGLAEAALLSGDLIGCLKGIRDHVSMQAADALTLAALCHHAASDLPSARSMAAQAAQKFSTHGFLASHRRRNLAALCQTLENASP